MKEELRKASEFKALSDEYRAKYNATGDPSVIAEFYKRSFMAPKEVWVKNEIIRWYLEHDFESIRTLGPSKGEKTGKKGQTRYIMAVKRLMIFDRVNDLVSKGLTKVKAFDTVAQNFLGASCSPDAIRNAYYAAKKFEPEIRIEETETEIIRTCGPTRVHLYSFRGYGFWEYRTRRR